jgi:hypothetical protein
MKKMLLAVLVGALAAPLYADCTIDVSTDDTFRGTKWNLIWNRVNGATSYLIEQWTDANPNLVRRQSFQANSDPQFIYDVERTSTVPVRVHYRVIATVGLEQCSDEVTVDFAPTDWFRRATAKSVVPLVGSTRGLNGSNFKTSMRLRATAANQSGKLVWHPQNVKGSALDPTVAYHFTNEGDVLEYDDLGPVFGQSGLGTLDIIPDATTDGELIVPTAELRLYNVREDGGTFGTLESQTQAFPFITFAPTAIRSMNVTVPGPEMRLNIGIRTVLFSIIAIRLRRDNKNIDIPDNYREIQPDTLTFQSAKDFTGYDDLRPGDVIQIFSQGANGGYIPMYSLTDNTTNDPSLFVPPTPVDTNLTRYEMPQPPF